jgi:hypothetical protein
MRTFIKAIRNRIILSLLNRRSASAIGLVCDSFFRALYSCDLTVDDFTGARAFKGRAAFIAASAFFRALCSADLCADDFAIALIFREWGLAQTK